MCSVCRSVFLEQSLRHYDQRAAGLCHSDGIRKVRGKGTRFSAYSSWYITTIIIRTCNQTPLEHLTPWRRVGSVWGAGQWRQPIRDSKPLLEWYKLRCWYFQVFHPQEVFRKLCANWVCALKNILQPCPKVRKFEEYWFQGAPNYQSAQDSALSWAYCGNRNLFTLFQNKVVMRLYITTSS